MSRVLRLLGYLRRYAVPAAASVVLMAAVGLLEAFRVLLIGPIFDNVLHPGVPTHAVPLLGSLNRRFGTNIHLDLHALAPPFIHNAWDIVAFALIASTLLKSVCDFAGTYLVNYAGFGMITDLRDDLYETMLRLSVSFFQRHATGVLLSTLINDIERVQYAMSSVLSDFLQQFFTLIFTLALVIALGGKLAWLLLLFVPVVAGSVRRIGRNVRTTTRGGQDKLAEIQNILHETITGNRIVKAFNMERWEMGRFRDAARRLFRANLRSVRAQAVSSPLMDAIGAVAIALLLLVGRGQIQSRTMTEGSSRFWWPCLSSTIRYASSRSTTTIFSRRWVPRARSSALWMPPKSCRRSRARIRCGASATGSSLRTCASRTRRTRAPRTRAKGRYCSAST